MAAIAAKGWALPSPDRAWLVTGGTGQVGKTLAEARPPGVRLVLPGRAALDLAANALAIAPLIAREGITAIINCAAFTRVDQAEDQAELAARVNGAAPAALAKAAALAGIPIVQLSTDYVFSGDKPAPYTEDDRPVPWSVYGRTKLDGERGVIASGARHAILRTSWVFSAAGTNFVRTMLRLAQERDVIDVVADQHGCPTHAGDLAGTIIRVTSALEAGAFDTGLWHVANRGETTWHGLAARILARAAAAGGSAAVARPIASADFPQRAPRPANSRLCAEKLARDHGIVLRDWESAVDETVDRILAQHGGPPS